jgi:mannose-6-phosphate isomerase-like protein (cupin superfamily)
VKNRKHPSAKFATLLLMKPGYGVVWREGGDEQPGRLTLSPKSIRLTGLDSDESTLRVVGHDEIVGAELRRARTDSSRATLVLTLDNASEVEIESGVDKWIVSALLENVCSHVLGEAATRRQVMLAVKLKPGRLEAARELLRGGPPFDPSLTALASHGVFLLDDEVLFVFETHGSVDLERLLDLDGPPAVAAWRELSTGEVRLVEQAYSWNRDDPLPGRSSPEAPSPAGQESEKPPTLDAPDAESSKELLPPAHPFDIEGVKARLEADGGYEIVHRSKGLEIGVYVLVAPEPDRQQPHADDEVYIVLEGNGVLEIEGKPVELREGHAVFVPAGAEHQFTGYEHLTVLVIFERR